jgi:hypothetical protein
MRLKYLTGLGVLLVLGGCTPNPGAPPDTAPGDPGVQGVEPVASGGAPAASGTIAPAMPAAAAVPKDPAGLAAGGSGMPIPNGR